MAANASAQLPRLHEVAKRCPLMGTSTCLTAQLLSVFVQAVVYVFQVAHWRTCGCALMCAPYADLQPTRDCGSAAPLPAVTAPQGWAVRGRCLELAGALQEPGEGAAGGGPYGAADAGQEQVGTGCRRGVKSPAMPHMPVSWAYALDRCSTPTRYMPLCASVHTYGQASLSSCRRI